MIEVIDFASLVTAIDIIMNISFVSIVIISFANTIVIRNG